ncbi:MAG: phytanoyl-CoA dioxygenase family protein [Pseudomonadales bacterium]
MSLQRIPASAPLERILDAYAADGGLIVEGIFPAEVIGELRDGIVAAARAFRPGGATQGLGEAGKAFVGANTIRFSSLGKVSPAFFDLLDNPLYAAIADAVLLPACGSYWVNTGQAMLIGPGEPAQVLHRDCDNWPQLCGALWPDCPEVTVSAMIALEEVTEALGATRVIPGSHRWPDYAERGSQAMTVPAEMQPGDALVYSGKVVHGGGANRSADRWRMAMHLSFLVGWLTPEESSPLDYTDADLATRSARVQRLLGHRSYDPRPHYGGGLWLRNADKIEADPGYPARIEEAGSAG